jgi:hypothetical protein
LEIERQDKPEISSDWEQLEFGNKNLKIENEQLKDNCEELTNENGEVVRCQRDI